MGVANLGYVILQMQDPAGWAKFAKDVLGFGLAKSRDRQGTKYLRMDKAPFRYMIEKGEVDRFVCAGYEMGSKKDFEALISKLGAKKVEVSRGDAREAKRRAVKGFASFFDPSGNKVEIYYGRDKSEAFKPGHGIKEFKTGKMGLGHLVLPAPENQKTINFYRKVMGFGVSDDLSLPAFAPVGRHANDEMVSFYFFAPGGIGFEVGYDGKQVKDWSKFKPTKSTIGDIWGHEYDFPVVGE